MQVDVLSETVIHRPVDEVAAYAADPTNAPDWYEHIDSVEWETEPVVRVGARAAYGAHFLGKRLAYTYEIVEHEPGTRLRMRTTESPFPMDVDYQLEPAGPGQTRASVRVRGAGRGMYGMPGFLQGPMVRRSVQGDLGRLKRIVEDGAG